MITSRSMTWKNRWSLISIILLIGLAILIPNDIWNVLLSTLGGIYLISYVWAKELHQHLSGERVLQGGWLAVGDHLTEHFKIINDSWLPALWVELTDESNIPGYRPSVAYQVPGKAEHKWRQTAVCLQRGRFTIGPWRLRTGDPFGLFEVIISYPQSNEMVIYPPLDTDVQFSLPTGYQQGDVSGRDRAFHVTNNIAGVRDYQPMDPLNWIHWPSTAHRGALAVREFEIEAAGDAWILIDLEEQWHAGEGLNSTEEYGVLLASALATRILAQNRAVGLATYSTNPTILTSQKGEPQHWRILSALAEVVANSETDLSSGLTDIQQIISRGSSLIIITPNLDFGWFSNLLSLGRKQIKTTIILLDRESFLPTPENKFSVEKGRQLAQEMGYRIEIVQSGDINMPGIDTDGESEFKITPLGRAVKVEG